MTQYILWMTDDFVSLVGWGLYNISQARGSSCFKNRLDYGQVSIFVSFIASLVV